MPWSLSYSKHKSLCRSVYVLERFLERVSLSPYRRQFIVKGGFLISTLVGLEARTTMDLDTTVKGFPINHAFVRAVFENICQIPLDDNFEFSVLDSRDIRESDDCGGIRVMAKAEYGRLSVPFTVDVTTGDAMTPSEVEYSFSLAFDDRTISILSYNLETVLAEKLEAILSRGSGSTRVRDFYDVSILTATRGQQVNLLLLRLALRRTVQKRKTMFVYENYEETLAAVKASKGMQQLWQEYRKAHAYAADMAWDDACDAAARLIRAVMEDKHLPQQEG